MKSQILAIGVATSLIPAFLLAETVVSFDAASQVTSASPNVDDDTALSVSTPLVTASGNPDYSGPDVYGGLNETGAGLWNVSVIGGSGARVRLNDNTGSDVDGLFLFEANGASFTVGNDTLDASDILSSQIQRLSTATIRFVVEDSGSFYISDPSANFSTGGTGTQTDSFSVNALSSNWYDYDPSTVEGISLIGSEADPGFSDIDFVGFALFAEGAGVDTGGVNFGVRTFTVTALSAATVVNFDAANQVSSDSSNLTDDTALNASTPLVVASGNSDYSGPDVYGGMNETDAGLWNISGSTGSGARVRLNDNTGNDVDGLFLFATNGVGFAVGSDTLDASSIFTSQIQRLGSATIRFVVEDAGSFYISDPSANFSTGESGNQLDSFSVNALSTNWFNYDPSTAAGISSIGSGAAPGFNDIDFVGFTLFAEGAGVDTGGTNFGVRTFTVTAVSGYGGWQAANGTSQSIDLDHDNDGVQNGVEYFLGGATDTTGFTAMPGVVDSAGTLSVTWTKATDFTGTYATDFVVETSTTLTGVWNSETLGIDVTVTGDDVKYTFPAGTRNFARLRVTGP